MLTMNRAVSFAAWPLYIQNLFPNHNKIVRVLVLALFGGVILFSAARGGNLAASGFLTLLQAKPSLTVTYMCQYTNEVCYEYLTTLISIQ